MEQFRMCELSFRGEELTENWARAEVNAVLACGEVKREVSGFYAGDGVYKVRFLPEKAGTWQYQVSGAVTAQGSVKVAPASEAPVAAHGPVRAEECHFRHQDGTIYYPFGTTVYALMHQKDSVVEETFESLKNAPFNKVRFCVFPKHYDFNHNEPPVYAFEKNEDGSWDVSRPCFAFWERLEKILARLEELEIQADLILFHPYDRWGFSRMTQEENLLYLDYLLRRLSAFPHIWWSLANEYDLCAFKSVAQWEEIERYVAEHDPSGHLLSNHNCFALWDFSRPNVTHASIQTKMLTRISEWRSKYKKPVVIDECCYEGNIEHMWGSISAREMTYRFWRVVTTGGYCTHGETFLSPDDVLWWAAGGKLRGESPARIGFLRGIVESLPGPIEPVDSHMAGLIRLAGAGEEEKERMLQSAPPERRFFAGAILRMDETELRQHAASEFAYEGRCGEDAFLTFYELRTCARSFLELPENHVYRVELIDVWEMTRTVLIAEASGKTELKLPGREGMAVLATRIG